MPKLKRTQLAFVDYKPARLCKPKSGNWCVRFQYKIPGTDKFKHFRRRVRPLDNVFDREKLGKQIEKAINSELSSGWSPFGSSKEYDFVANLLKYYLNFSVI